MKIRACTALLAIVLSTALICNAEVKVEQDAMGTAGQVVGYAISPDGAHIAVMANKGSRYVVSIDGVEGPIVDELVNLNAQQFVSSDNMRLDMSKNEVVLFSDDSAHCAYYGKVGDEYIVVLDGKELARGSFLTNYTPALSGSRLSFSHAGKHLFYIESGQTGERIVIDGKPELWGYDRNSSPKDIFSPDGSQYAYLGSSKDPAGNIHNWAVVNGQQVNYFGDSLQFTARNHLFSILHDRQFATVLVDNKPVMQVTAINKLLISPLGTQIAIVASPKPTDPPEFFMNGVLVPGTDGLRIKSVFFSPDGNHYAAHCQTSNFTELMFIDGKKGREYSSILDDAANGEPQYTPDSSKLIYMAQNNNKWFVVANDDESDGINVLETKSVVVAPGARFAYVTDDNPGANVFVDGKSVPTSPQATCGPIVFSADGRRYAFVCGALVIDGQGIQGISGTANYLFSPDGKHIAYDGSDASNSQRSGVWVDQKLIAPGASGEQMCFSPDSQHLFCVGAASANQYNRLYVDGKPAVNLPGNSQFISEPSQQCISPDNVLTVFANENGAITRYRITPSADTSIAALLEAP